MGCGASSPPSATEPSQTPHDAPVTRPLTASSSASVRSKTVTPSSVAAKDLDNPDKYKEIHSAIRWNKPLEEIRSMIGGKENLVNISDPKNGNRPIHIAAQNGHLEILQYLVSNKADINVVNLKGNTALHMAIEYDYVEASKFLIDSGADLDIKNSSEFPAYKGIEGTKTFELISLSMAKTKEEVLVAFKNIEKARDPLEKSSIVSAGLKAKKTLGPAWTDDVQAKFKLLI